MKWSMYFGLSRGETENPPPKPCTDWSLVWNIECRNRGSRGNSTRGSSDWERRRGSADGGEWNRDLETSIGRELSRFRDGSNGDRRHGDEKDSFGRDRHYREQGYGYRDSDRDRSRDRTYRDRDRSRSRDRDRCKDRDRDRDRDRDHFGRDRDWDDDERDRRSYRDDYDDEVMTYLFCLMVIH